MKFNIVQKAFAINFEPITGIGGLQVGDDPGGTLENFFTILLGFFTIIGGIMFLIYFVLGALSWISSTGDREKIAKAQRYMSNALIGLIFVVLAWAFTGIIGATLGFSILDLATNIGNL